MRISSRTVALLTAVVGACGDSAGAGPIDASGVVKDDFAGTALPGVALTVDGATTLHDTSLAGGAYRIDNVPRNTTLTVVGSVTSYRPTRNSPIAVTNASVTRDLAMVSVTDATRQYTGLSLTPTAATAVVFLTLVDPAGQPLEGVPLSNITLTDATPAVVGLGPYVFGSGGDLVSNATLSTTTAYGGRSRVGFLDVPAGTYTASVTFTGTGGQQTKTATIVTAGNAATLLRF